MTQTFKPDDSESFLQSLGYTQHSRTAFEQYRDQAFLQSGIAGKFIEFLTSAFDLMNVSATADLRDATHMLPTDYLSNPDAFCKHIWNRQAIDWPMIESPANYAMTIDTYATYIRFDGSKKQTIVSLGAGPGLYEAFMRTLFSPPVSNYNIKIYCVDYAQKMTAWNKEMLKRTRITGVHPVTDDMMSLTFPDQSVDQVICNNALQWVSDWKKALSEMVRIIRHNGRRRLYLIINLHSMVVRDAEGSVILTLGDFTLEQILDELEAQNCDINNIRNIVGRQGVGQMGGTVDRAFIEAEFQPQGCTRRWRDFNGKPKVRGIYLS